MHLLANDRARDEELKSMRARDRMRKEDITRLREQVVAILRSQEEG